MANQRTSSRKHGLQAPFNRYQLMSWALFFIELAAIILVYLPPLDPTLRLAAGGVMLLLLISTLVYGFRTSSCDPTDPTVYEERRTRELGEDFITELKHYCSICDTHVMPRTKHCGQCNRCVNTFDHHCQWLNNCVGAKNYGFFAKTTILLFLNSSTKLIVGAYSIGKYYMRPKEFKNNVQQFYDTESDIDSILYFTIASILVNLFFWLLMLQLIVLHVWLKKNNLTTYEYIVQKREKTAAKKNQEGIHFTSAKKSKVIKKIDDDGASTSQATSNNTVVKFIKARSSARQEHSHFFGADDSTKEQELGKQRLLINRPTDAIESLGTFVPTTTPPQIARKTDKKMAMPQMKSPMAILHDTSIASDTPENMDSINSKMMSPKERKGTSNTEYKTRKTSEVDEKEDVVIKIPSRVIKTQSEAPIEEEVPENQHPSFPEIGECDISDDKPTESSKVMKFMDSIKEKVVFKNPLGKVLFVKSGIDLDGSTDQAHLVSSPTNLFKPYLPRSIAMGNKNHLNLRAIESPNDLKKLRSEVYYINKPKRGSDASIQLPNSCRIAFDKEENMGYPYMTARPAFTKSAVPSTTLADDKPMLERGTSHDEKDRNNPFE